jgi:hypothetical protein
MPNHESRAKRFFDLIISSFSIVGCVLAPSLNPCAAVEVSPVEARAIAKEAYIYGFPMVDGYRIQYAYFVDHDNAEFKAPWNQIRNVPRVFTPDDKVVQIPNSDTPYSTLGLDLRAEPMVIAVPPIEKSRYYSVQLVDLYTFNFAYIGSRTTGNDGSSLPRRRSHLERRSAAWDQESVSLRNGICPGGFPKGLYCWGNDSHPPPSALYNAIRFVVTAVWLCAKRSSFP